MTNCDWMETQNLVISFDYSWFLAKNLAYAECPIMKFHYRNSSSIQDYFDCNKHYSDSQNTPFLILHDIVAWSLEFWKRQSKKEYTLYFYNNEPSKNKHFLSLLSNLARYFKGTQIETNFWNLVSPFWKNLGFLLWLTKILDLADPGIC